MLYNIRGVQETYYNLLWRGSTLYIPAIAGLLWIMQAIMQDIQGVVGKRKYANNCLSVPKIKPYPDMEDSSDRK